MVKTENQSLAVSLSSGKRVTSTTKALMILDCFSPAQPELTLAQISKLLNMPKSTLLNQIRTLEDAGLLLKVKSGPTYRLGYKIMELSYCAHMSAPVVQYAIPVMEDLQVATGETIYLTSHLNGRVFYMECLYPSRRFVSYSVSGKTLPMHCTSCGKAMLSQMHPDQVDAIIAQHGLPSRTKYTITDRDVLLEKLEQYRKLGYATDNEEETIGVRCIAMAIRTSCGDVAGALSISGSSLSIRDDKFPEYVQLLSRSCNILSQYSQLFPAIQTKNSEVSSL